MPDSIHGNLGFIPPDVPKAQPLMFKPVPPPREPFTRDVTASITAALTSMPSAPKRWSPEQFRPPLSAEQTALNALKEAMPTPRSKEAEPKIETQTPSAPPPLSIPTELKTRHLQIVPPLPPSQRSSPIDRASTASQKALTSTSVGPKQASYATGALRKATQNAIGGHRKLSPKIPNYGIFIPLPGTAGTIVPTQATPAVKQAQSSVASSIVNFAIQWGRKLFS